jgi:hypothetical protein
VTGEQGIDHAFKRGLGAIGDGGRR